jgi:hypothetical protein
MILHVCLCGAIRLVSYLFCRVFRLVSFLNPAGDFFWVRRSFGFVWLIASGLVTGGLDPCRRCRCLVRAQASLVAGLIMLP